MGEVKESTQLLGYYSLFKFYGLIPIQGHKEAEVHMVSTRHPFKKATTVLQTLRQGFVFEYFDIQSYPRFPS